MSQQNHIKPDISSILYVPIEKYEKDFTFIVNGEEIQTSRIIADLFSPKISQFHAVDPTINIFFINTKSRGNFSHILDLINFQNQNINEEELEFIIEVIEQLENNNIELVLANRKDDLTKDNALNILKNHERNPTFYSRRILNDIDFISKHFYELFEYEQDDASGFIESIENITQQSIERIVHNENLRLLDEDQLITFVNELYSKDTKCSCLYSAVYFANASADKMQEFLSLFNIDDISEEIWKAISIRLSHETAHAGKIENDFNVKRYAKHEFSFSKENSEEFSGIISHLFKKTKGNIEQEISITASTCDGPHPPRDSLSFEDKDKYFASKNEPDQWICFDFKNHKITPTDYTIRSYSNGIWHPKSWVIECSNDNIKWIEIDSEENCSHLKGKSFIHTFSLSKKICERFKYIRLRMTNANWEQNNTLRINSFEVYGSLY